MEFLRRGGWRGATTDHDWSSARRALHAAAALRPRSKSPFACTDEHISPDALRAARSTADPLFDDALDADRIDDTCDAVASCAGGASYAPPVLAALVAALAHPPAWVDWDQVRVGQDVFARYLPACTATLYHLSLVGGFSAERIARVVASTGYLNGNGRDVLARILETATFLAHVTEPGGLRPHRPGWTAALRVRLLHCRVRRRLRRSCAWDARAWDEPINAAQLAVTQLAFSAMVLSGVQLLAGAPLPQAQQDGYLHLWRYIGWLLGIPDEHNACVSARTAQAHLESHLSYLIEPGPIGMGVAHAVLALRLPSGEPEARFAQRVHVCRAFIGDDLADSLRLPRPRRARDIFLGRIELRLLSAYSQLCTLPVLGQVLLRVHRWGLRLLAARSTRFGFPLRREPLIEHMARASECPFIAG